MKQANLDWLLRLEQDIFVDNQGVILTSVSQVCSAVRLSFLGSFSPKTTFVICVAFRLTLALDDLGHKVLAIRNHRNVSRGSILLDR